MSRSVTNRPSMSGVQYPSGQARGGLEGHGNSSRPTLEERTQRRDAYTVIVPDEEKRKRLQEKAAEEQQKFEEYRERNRTHHVSYVGTVGGSETRPSPGHTPAGNHAVTHTQRPNKTPFEKSRQYRDAEKRREETEIAKKKAEQRMKTAANEDRERQRKEKYDEDRKKKMDAFLSQFETKSKHSSVSREAAATAASAAAVTSSLTHGEAAGDSTQTSSLDILQSAFPNYSQDELAEMLVICDGNVDLATEMLSH